MIRGRLDLQNSGTSFWWVASLPWKQADIFFSAPFFPACFLVLFLLLTGLPISHTERQPLLSEETKHLRTELLHLLSGCDVMSHRLQHSRRQQAKKINDGALWLLLYGFFVVQAGCTGGGALDLSNLDEMLNSDATRTFICRVEVSCLIFHFYSSRWGNVVFWKL